MTHWGLVCTCSPTPRPIVNRSESGGEDSNPRTCWRVALNVWRSWLTYNPGRLDAPGVLQVRLRRYSVRLILLIACTYLVAHAHSLSLDRGLWFFDLGIDAAIVFVLPMMLALPVLVDADQYRAEPTVPEEWERIVQGIHTSDDPIERDCLFLRRVVSDGSPVLVPRAVYREHTHILGDSGSGKTSLGLLSFIEQMVAFGDCSVVVLDMKGDSGELLATLLSAADRARSRTGASKPWN